jgi:SAM-dependent methyltransferase
VGQKKYLSIVSHYESCLEKHGDTHLGVDWPNENDVDTRCKVMLEVIRPEAMGKTGLLDFGCGTSYLFEYIVKNEIEGIEYAGLDLSPRFIKVSQSKFPMNQYYCLDILDGSSDIPSFDYIVLNGVFTEKRDLSFEEMFSFFKILLTKIFQKVNVGMAFNVMSKHVDWERDELFHLPFDALAAFLTSQVTRDFVIRNDYGLYEYTTYLYKPKPTKDPE